MEEPSIEVVHFDPAPCRACGPGVAPEERLVTLRSGFASDTAVVADGIRLHYVPGGSGSPVVLCMDGRKPGTRGDDS